MGVRIPYRLHTRHSAPHIRIPHPFTTTSPPRHGPAHQLPLARPHRRPHHKRRKPLAVAIAITLIVIITTAHSIPGSRGLVLRERRAPGLRRGVGRRRRPVAGASAIGLDDHCAKVGIIVIVVDWGSAAEVLGEVFEEWGERRVVFVVVVVVLVYHCGVKVFFLLSYLCFASLFLFVLFELGFGAGVVVAVDDDGGVDVRLGPGRAAPAACGARIHFSELVRPSRGFGTQIASATA